MMIDKQLELIEKHDLGKMVRWLLEYNPSQALPYHNFSHSLDVMHYAHTAWEYDKLSSFEKPMLIAALFHDFGHGGGFFWLGCDDRNTVNATAGLKRYRDEVSTSICDITQLEKFRGSCENAIWFICDLMFPHKELSVGNENNTRYNAVVNCLRDADLYQYCSTLMASTVGIKQEYFKHLHWGEFIEKHIDFMETIRYHTSWGKQIAEPKLKETIEHMKRFRELCFCR